MFTVVKEIHFCYGHRLLDYDGRCAHAHGHNALLQVELRSTRLDDQGMVVDFAEVERQINEFVDTKLDHRMLLRRDDPMLEALRNVGEDPFIMEDNPTAENIAKLILEAARESGLPVVAIRLWETKDSMAEYRVAEA
jgi:6-pyruvoyltetrahydropterin/6-carboxytetrahydropterin synthase